jgi:hypothetical protein
VLQDDDPPASQPVLSFSAALSYLNHAHAGFSGEVVCGVCGPADVDWDQLHHMASNVTKLVDVLMSVLSENLTCEGAVKTPDELARWRPPDGSQKNVHSQWSGRGYHLWKFIAGLSKDSSYVSSDTKTCAKYSMPRPLEGFDGNSAPAFLAHWGNIISHLEASVPGVTQLESSGRRGMDGFMTAIKEWGMALGVIVSVGHHPEAHHEQFRALLLANIKMMWDAMRTIHTSVVEIDPGLYFHYPFCHMIEDLDRGFNLIDSACYAMEGGNHVSKHTRATKTSRGGGHAKKDGSTQHMSETQQCLARQLDMTAGVVSLVSWAYGLGTGSVAEKQAAQRRRRRVQRAQQD